MKKHKLLTPASFILLVCLSPLSAQITTTYNWTGPAEGGVWGDPGHWDGEEASIPKTENDRAILGNTTVNRVVVLNNGGGSPGILGDLVFTQTSNATNTLEIRRAIGLRNTLQIGASGGGQSILHFNTMTAAASSPTGNYAAVTGSVRPLMPNNHGVTINSGGVIIFDKTRNNNDANIRQTQIFNPGTFNISGGEFIVRNGTYTSSGNATRMSHYITQGTSAERVDFTMSSGRLVVGAQSTNAGTAITDTNLEINGSITLTGGTTQIHLFSTTDAAKVIAADTLTMGGHLLIDTTSATLTEDGIFALFAASSFMGGFDSVSLANGGVAFTSMGNGIWNLDHLGINYSFSEGNGMLTVLVPEPASIGLLVGGAGAMLALLRRRHPAANR